MVTKRDSVKRTWHTVADHLFNNKYTAANIMPGRQYKFRIYAKNDMGMSEAAESPTWEVNKKKGKFQRQWFKLTLVAGISLDLNTCIVVLDVREL